MRFSTPVIFAALAVLATVKALPAGTDGEKGLEKQGDAVEGTQDNTGKAKNKIPSTDNLHDKLDHLTGDRQVTEDVRDGEGSDVVEAALDDDDIDLDDDFLLSCLQNDEDLEDCPDLEGFDSDSCLLLPHVNCLKKVRKFLKNHHEA